MIIQSARLTEQLRRLLDIRGSSPQLELVEQIIPVVVAGDLRDTTAQATASPRIAVGAGEQPAVAAQFSYFVLDNQATSDFDILIHRISVCGGSQQRFSIGWHAVGLATPTLHQRRYIDSAFRSTNPVGGVYSGAAAAVPGLLIFDQVVRPTNDDREVVFRNPLLLRPDGFFVVLSNTLNMNMFCAIEWEERPRA